MSYFDQLEVALTQAAARHQPVARRRRYVLPIAAVAAALVLVVAATVLTQLHSSPSASASSIEVRQEGDWLRVRVERLDAPPVTVAHDLRDAGFTVHRFAATTGPSQVGRVLELNVLNSEQKKLGNLDVQVPVGSHSVMQVIEGVAAPRGAAYTVTTDAFAAGEPLACLRSGVRLSDLLAAASRRHVTVRFPQGANTAADAEVLQATATSAASVLVLVDSEHGGQAATCGP